MNILVLVTATVQFNLSMAKCSENQAKQAAKEEVEDTFSSGSCADLETVKVTEVEVTNLDSEDGSFK